MLSEYSAISLNTPNQMNSLPGQFALYALVLDFLAHALLHSDTMDIVPYRALYRQILQIHVYRQSAKEKHIGSQ